MGVTAIYCEKHTHVLWVAHVYIVGNEGIRCGKHMYLLWVATVYIVGNKDTYCGSSTYTLWVTCVCVVGNTLWETYCGIVGDNTHIVDEVLWRIMYILWTSDVNV